MRCEQLGTLGQHLLLNHREEPYDRFPLADRVQVAKHCAELKKEKGWATPVLQSLQEKAKEAREEATRRKRGREEDGEGGARAAEHKRQAGVQQDIRFFQPDKRMALTLADNDDLNTRIFRWAIHRNVPLRALRDPLFTEIISASCSNFTLNSRRDMMRRELDESQRRVPRLA